MTYCGNNYNDPDVVVGLKRVGTRYECLRKGIGIGRNLPFDPSYAVDYRPIDRTRTYCGKERHKPVGYNRMGSPSSCLKVGVGMGKRMRALQGRRALPRKKSRKARSPKRNKKKARSPKRNKKKARSPKRKKKRSKRKSRKRKKSK